MIPLIQTLATDWSWQGFMGNIWWSILAFVLGGLFGRKIFLLIKKGLGD